MRYRAKIIARQGAAVDRDGSCDRVGPGEIQEATTDRNGSCDIVGPAETERTSSGLGERSGGQCTAKPPGVGTRNSERAGSQVESARATETSQRQPPGEIEGHCGGGTEVQATCGEGGAAIQAQRAVRHEDASRIGTAERQCAIPGNGQIVSRTTVNDSSIGESVAAEIKNAIIALPRQRDAPVCRKCEARGDGECRRHIVTAFIIDIS